MENVNAMLMPMDPNMIQHHESHDQSMINTQNRISYVTYIGKLLYMAHMTQLNILYVTIMMEQFAKSPLQENWTGVKRILKYLMLQKDPN